MVSNNMSGIQTFIFLDIETTGEDQTNRTKITEISLVAVKRQHLIDTRIGFSPRVQHKLTLCINPRKMINPEVTESTGLCNDLLEFEPTFNDNVFFLIHTFINLLTKPVCLIAQNGMKFDFPILKNHLEKLGTALSQDLACADCLHAFYDIMESYKVNKKNISIDTNNTKSEFYDELELYFNKKSLEVEDENDRSELELYFNKNSLDVKDENERSPTRFISLTPQTPKKCDQDRLMKVKRRFPWSDGEKPKEKYRLKDIYERLLNRRAINAHHAENDCLLALECAAALSEDFVKWVDENNCLFSQIRPMTIGVRLGD